MDREHIGGSPPGVKKLRLRREVYEFYGSGGVMNYPRRFGGAILKLLVPLLFILSVSSRCSRLEEWILRTFASRDKITMLTLFKSLVLSRLDYAFQLWSLYKAKDRQALL